MKNIVLIGDSIRMGYQEVVCGRLAGWGQVWAPAENGRHSENLAAHLDQWAICRPADVVHINCGLHDIARWGDSPAIPLDDYAKNVRYILTRLQTETDAAVIWALTTPVNQDWHHKNKSFDRFEGDVVKYNAVAQAICGELNIKVNDLYSLVMSVGRDDMLTEDGVHFTAEGYCVLGGQVAECIKRTTNSQRPDETED